MSDSPGTRINSIFAQTRVEGRCLAVRLRGPSIGQREAEIITSIVEPEIEAADDLCQYLVLDMEDVEFLSSMGIGMLLDLRSRAAIRKMKIVLSNVCEQLSDMLHIVKLERVLTICRTRQEYQRAIKK